MASVAVTLFETEESLAALLDTMEMVTPDQEQAFLADFETALTTAADKRDRVAGRIAQLEAQQGFASAEIKRLQEFKRVKAAEQERLEGYVTYVIQRLGKDAKDKWRKLQGHTSSLFLRACAPSVEITDQALIPLEFQRATVTLPAAAWNDILNAMPELMTTTCKLEAEKTVIKANIEYGVDVPGAKLVTDKTTVGRK